MEKNYRKLVRVISVPCFENFVNMGKDYLNKLISGAKYKIAIEAASALGWHQFIGSEGLFFGMDELFCQNSLQD